MSRPSRTGLDYFPLDTTILNDIKIRRIKKQFGAEAFLLYISLLCDIYSNGYYIEATDDYLFDQGEKLGIPENSVLEIILACVKIGLFCEEFFMEHRILTSKSIQDRFSLATKKRSLNQIVEYKYDFISAPETPVSVSETPPKQGLSTQSKVKESKVNNESESARAYVREEENTGKGFDEKCTLWQKELLEDEEWCASAVRQAGIGVGFHALLPAKMQEFQDFIISSGEKDTIQSKKDYVRRFHYWWLYYGLKKHSGGDLPAFRPCSKPERKSRVEEIMELGQRSTELALQLYNQAV